MNIEINEENIPQDLNVDPFLGNEYLYNIDKNLYYKIEWTADKFPILLADYSNLEKLVREIQTHESLRFKILADIVGVDYRFYKPNQGKFGVIYNFLSMKFNKRLFVKVLLKEDRMICSLDKLFASASWLEREVYDMFGIQFSDMKDSRRILTDYGFKHFPLRKDFPLTGYDEIYYDIAGQEVAYRPVVLDQEYRKFDTETPWLGTRYKIEE